MRTTNRASEKQHIIPIDPYITQKKYDILVARCSALQQKKPSLAKEVSDLATLGDFSENFEYQQAKRELRSVTNQIKKLQHRIDTAIIIEKNNTNTITLGSTVTVKNTDAEEKNFTILGSSEARPTEGIISHTSPIGTALIGKKLHDTVTITLPKKTITYTVIAIF